MNITWAQALEAMYGTSVSEHQIPVWEHYLRADNTSSAELVPAIELAAAENIKPEEWRVTVRDLRRWLKVYRARSAAEKRTEEAAARKAHFICEWREKLQRGASRDDATCSAEKQGWSVLEQNDVLAEILK